MAVGAARRDVLEQFLAEAVMISMAGGMAGILIGVAIPLSVRFFTDDIADSDFAAIDHGGVHGVAHGGPGLRHSPGESRGAVESDGSAAIRVTLLSSQECVLHDSCRSFCCCSPAAGVRRLFMKLSGSSCCNW